MIHPRRLVLPLLVTAAACVVTDDEGDAPAEETPTTEATVPRARASQSIPIGPAVYGDPRQRLSREQIEQGRFDRGWQRYVQLDQPGDSATAEWTEEWTDISAESLRDAPMILPVAGEVAGPSVARVQIALDHALFSPGIIDGRWGMNTEKAIYWLQEREGLPATGRVDSATWRRLVEIAGIRDFARSYTVTAEDVAGPFVEIPEDIYEQAELECMCYESLGELLAERFHTTEELLSQLNPGVQLDQLSAGETIHVPAVREETGASLGPVARLVISDGGHYLHAVDAGGRILAHFPTTLGSEYAPSPQGDFTIINIAPDPTWHYQPDLLTGVDDSDDPAVIPPGPNNAVGVVWMELSEPHYGIHGTSAPETIGYTTSHGCVRLTNWDASFLSSRIEAGIDVEFRDIT